MNIYFGFLVSQSEIAFFYTIVSSISLQFTLFKHIFFGIKFCCQWCLYITSFKKRLWSQPCKLTGFLTSSVGLWKDSLAVRKSVSRSGSANNEVRELEFNIEFNTRNTFF